MKAADWHVRLSATEFEIMKISKSKFVAGCQCLKRLWFQVHQPELAAQPDAAAETIMEQGHEVGLLARQLFRGGVEVDGSGGLEQAIRTTQELIANPEVPAIYEGAFERNGVFVRVDPSSRIARSPWFPYIVARLATKAATTSDTLEPTQTSSRQPSPSRRGFAMSDTFRLPRHST